MQNSSTQSKSMVSSENQKSGDVAPRQKTIDFLRQFARACQSINLSDNNSQLGVMVLN